MPGYGHARRLIRSLVKSIRNPARVRARGRELEPFRRRKRPLRERGLFRAVCSGRDRRFEHVRVLLLLCRVRDRIFDPGMFSVFLGSLMC